MKFIYSFSYFLNESVNRLNVLKEKYKNKISDDILKKLFDADPTLNKNYVSWIVNKYIKSKSKNIYLEDLYKITKYLTIFDKLKKQNKLEKNDINQYSDYKELMDNIKKLGGIGEITKDENYLINDRYYINTEEAEIFNEDDKYLIIIPKTLEASRFYSNNTEWCTQNKDSYDAYTKNDKLYIVINKELLNSDNVYKRMQFHFGTNQYMDIDDKDVPGYIKSKVIYLFKELEESFRLRYDVSYDDVSGNLVRVELNKKFGFCNYYGDEIIPCIYDNVTFFTKGYTKLRLNERYGLANNVGKILIPIKYIWIKIESKTNIIALDKTNEYIFDNTGKLISSKLRKKGD